MNIGKQIRTHRHRANMTQEKLAEILNVTAQAVSKWENDGGYPDISLLPELSAALGITMDELFESSAETHLRRIENMMENETTLSQDDFHYAESRLKEYCLDNDLRSRCMTLLAELYLHRSDSYRQIAATTAKEALSLAQNHSNHAALCSAAGGVNVDWSTSNHTALIDFYKEHLKNHPEDHSGYLWLLDSLITDGRLEEAEAYMKKMGTIQQTIHDYIYRAWIASLRYGWGADQEILDEMVERYHDNHNAWFSRANVYVKRGQYEKALADFRMAAEMEKAPRYTDSYESIAQICTLMGDKAGAVEAYQKVIEILRKDWHLQEGETVQGYIENIKQLQA